MLMVEVLRLPVMKKLSPSAETLGDRIRQARIAAGLTQEQLGAVAGISGSAITQLENGETKTLKPENLFKIAKKLRKSAEWLVTGEGTELPREEIYDALAELPGNNPQTVLDFIQYRIEKAEGLIASDKIGRYMAMIEAFKNDLDKRKIK